MTTMIYIESDVPEGMVLKDWRRMKRAPKRRMFPRLGLRFA
jgi:hypothetical protein